jgi:hypothetical protein
MLTWLRVPGSHSCSSPSQVVQHAQTLAKNLALGDDGFTSQDDEKLVRRCEIVPQQSEDDRRIQEKVSCLLAGHKHSLNQNRPVDE